MEISGQLQARTTVSSGREPWNSLYRRLSGLQSQFGRKSLASNGNWTPAVQHVAHRYMDWILLALQLQLYIYLFLLRMRPIQSCVLMWLRCQLYCRICTACASSGKETEWRIASLTSFALEVTFERWRWSRWTFREKTFVSFWSHFVKSVSANGTKDDSVFMQLMRIARHNL
jgi:hypothetical protein